MEELLMNIYGDTCRKIIEDLLFQYEGTDSKKEKRRFIELLEKPIKCYNENHGGGIKFYKVPVLEK